MCRSVFPCNDAPIVQLLKTCGQDISKVSISGLKGATYIDKVQNASQNTESSSALTITSETDRLYKSLEPEHAITVLQDGQPRYEIVRDALADVVVWNPWSEKAKGMSDFGPEDGYKQMSMSRFPLLLYSLNR